MNNLLCPHLVDDDKKQEFNKSQRPVKTIVKNGQSFRVKGAESAYRGIPFWDAVQNGQWESETFKIIDKYCSRSHSFIDVGAWIGPTTLFGACVSRYVYAVEPDPVAISELQTNIGLNEHLSRKISLYQGCISDSTGIVKIGNLKAFGNSETSILFDQADNCHTVDSVSFSDFVSHYGIQDCSLVKMDVEGAEAFILPSMIDFIKRYRPSLLISLHKPLYGDRGDEIVENIFFVLSHLYRQIYDIHGQKISNIKAVNDPYFDLVATNLPW